MCVENVTDARRSASGRDARVQVDVPALFDGSNNRLDRLAYLLLLLLLGFVVIEHAK